MRCFKLHGTWSEETCIGFQNSERIECRGCHHGAAIRKGRERRKDMKGKIEADVETLKREAEGVRREAKQSEEKTENPEGMKQCNRCKAFKLRNLDNFGAEPKAKDKFRYVCRPCDRIIVKNARLKKLGREDEIVPIKQAQGVRGEAKGVKEIRNSKPAGMQESPPLKIKKRSAASLLIEGYPGPDKPSIKNLPANPAPESDPFAPPQVWPDPKAPSMCIEVDLSPYPFLYEFILSGPDKFCRSPRNMVIFAVKRFYDVCTPPKG